MSRIILVAGLVLGLNAGALGAATAQRTALAQKVDPVGAKGRTLGLTRVLVPAKAQLALHHHPGTQIAYIDAGTLIYTVEKGSVTVYRGDAEKPKVVRIIRAGQTARIDQRQWIVEQPNVIHRAANTGNGTIQIYLATLFPNGAPPSIADR